MHFRAPPLGVSLDEGQHHVCVLPPDVGQVSVHGLGDAGAPQQPPPLLFGPEERIPDNVEIPALLPKQPTNQPPPDRSYQNMGWSSDLKSLHRDR